MNFETATRLLPWVTLLAAGIVLQPLERWPAAPPDAGCRGSGWRALAADYAWLKANLAWEAQDEARTRVHTRMAVAAEPANDYFRLNAARMCAFDFGPWREARAPGAPGGLRAQWRLELAQEAIALLAAAPQPTPAQMIEAGNISLYRLGDREVAAEYYRRAAEMPGAPWHAGRIHAELLRELGRPQEALRWLRAWLPRLPGDDPEAQRALVEARIAELERLVPDREPL